MPYAPTSQQALLADKLATYIASSGESEVFILRGYAGTGKTTMIGALSRILPQFKFRVVLLAPTGRAAKVLANYSDQPALTVHKKIYKPKSTQGGGIRFSLSPNMHSNTVFIVDEASMIGHKGVDNGFFESSSLIEDLTEYVFTGNNCRLIFSGDTAQLPPVGMEESPALSAKFLNQLFGMRATEFELTEVVRQQKESGILFNATQLRSTMYQEVPAIPHIELTGFKDVVRVEGYELQEHLESSYNKFGVEGTVLITRSNKRAVAYNGRIRAAIMQQFEEICTGDYLMVVKNNYYWLDESSKAGFIANGDILAIEKVRGIEEKYGFRFVDATVTMIDYPGEPAMEVKLLLSALYSDAPALSWEDSGMLYEALMQEYEHLPKKHQRMAELKKNPYYNALQVKFAYAVTCHKSQGGQWNHVYVEQSFAPKDITGIEFKRWLYTAVTRATERLYLINFTDDFFGGS
ncbi:MAG: AAA family ATPase [Sphingobacteriales bacterium JAD_PAG50586_3]|nr:MAG: AAA family ATPase [Sphingobacteriales bacterium JAD_PAG50586_3]